MNSFSVVFDSYLYYPLLLAFCLRSYILIDMSLNPSYRTSHQQQLPSYRELCTTELSMSVSPPPLRALPSIESLPNRRPDALHHGSSSSDLWLPPVSFVPAHLYTNPWSALDSLSSWHAGHSTVDSRQSTSYYGYSRRLPEIQPPENPEVESRVALSRLTAGQNFSVSISDLNFLSEQEQFIIRKRLMKTQWKQIQEEFEFRWKPISVQGLVMKLGRLRRKHGIIKHVLPARRKRAPEIMNGMTAEEVR